MTCFLCLKDIQGVISTLINADAGLAEVLCVHVWLHRHLWLGHQMHLPVCAPTIALVLACEVGFVIE